ncbi:hypothetical protein Tsubulata_031697 [Turnera subulata]|uniref:CCHC-type domain-containing protein n=1 Tax=Turnera subulata TaxID=218843 RepID=A0A9Q0JBT2_9ROSI|nr:hypothetical protein Tsubulata_031697 [Turnera subulata]
MIGKKLGVLMEVYQEEDWDMLSIMRVRVGLNLRNPLRTTLLVAAEEEEAFVVSFRYEQLPNFCFLCGRLGHGMKDCGYKSDEEIHDEGSLSYTEELRAPPFRKNFTVSKSPWKGVSPKPTASPSSAKPAKPSTSDLQGQYGNNQPLTIHDLTMQFASLKPAHLKGAPSTGYTITPASFLNLTPHQRPN